MKTELKNYIAFIQNGLWGIVNENMTVIIKPKYESLSCNGYFPKPFLKVIENNQYYFINENEEIMSDSIDLLEQDYDSPCSVHSSQNEDMLFSICIDGKAVFYDYDGNKAFDKVFDYDHENRIFENKLHMVMIEGKKGVIDREGHYVIEPKYEDLLIHWDGGYIITDVGDKKELYDIERKSYLDFECEDVWIGQEVIFVKRGDYAIFSKDFLQLTDFVYEDIKTNNIVIVAKLCGKIGMMDMKLNTIIPFMYDNLGFVYWENDEKNPFYTDDRMYAELDEIWHIINKENQIIFSSIKNYSGDNDCMDTTFAYVPLLDGFIEYYEDKILFFTKGHTKQYFIENDLAIYSGDSSYHFITVYKSDKCGFVNLKTGYIQECIFSDIYIESEDEIFVCLDNKWGLMDSCGNYLLEPKCIDNVHEHREAFFQSIKNMIKYIKVHLDSYDGYSIMNNHIVYYNKDVTDIYLRLHGFLLSAKSFESTVKLNFFQNNGNVLIKNAEGFYIVDNKSIREVVNGLITGVTVHNIDTSHVTDMSGLFQEKIEFNEDISHWNVSCVTNMSAMFYDAHAFNQPLNKWDVSNVTDMQLMFYYAYTFNQSLNMWDVSNVTDMHGMFEHAKSFNKRICTWNMSKVKNMVDMFYGAESYEIVNNIIFDELDGR